MTISTKNVYEKLERKEHAFVARYMKIFCNQNKYMLLILYKHCLCGA